MSQPSWSGQEWIRLPVLSTSWWSSSQIKWLKRSWFLDEKERGKNVPGFLPFKCGRVLKRRVYYFGETLSVYHFEKLTTVYWLSQSAKAIKPALDHCVWSGSSFKTVSMSHFVKLAQRFGEALPKECFWTVFLPAAYEAAIKKLESEVMHQATSVSMEKVKTGWPSSCCPQNLKWVDCLQDTRSISKGIF